MRKKIINDIKIIKAIKHYPYSIKIIIPKFMCEFLGINESSKIECFLDRKNKRIILKKKDN